MGDATARAFNLSAPRFAPAFAEGYGVAGSDAATAELFAATHADLACMNRTGGS